MVCQLPTRLRSPALGSVVASLPLSAPLRLSGCLSVAKPASPSLSLPLRLSACLSVAQPAAGKVLFVSGLIFSTALNMNPRMMTGTALAQYPDYHHHKNISSRYSKKEKCILFIYTKCLMVPFTSFQKRSSSNIPLLCNRCL